VRLREAGPTSTPNLRIQPCSALATVCSAGGHAAASLGARDCWPPRASAIVRDKSSQSHALRPSRRSGLAAHAAGAPTSALKRVC
jgi:hypothetical protein